MWRPIAQSLRGPSHLADGSPCQDSNSVPVFGHHLADTLVACVADGAGSAKFGEVGSSIAITSIIDNATAHFKANHRLDDLKIDDAIRWCEDARMRIHDEASVRNCEIRQLATTLCLAVLAPTRSVFLQIGDGAMILRSHGVCGVVFWPQSGEYANSTNFLTSDEYRQKLEYLETTSRFSDVALLTDGLERLALRFNSQTPHAPFFDPLFRHLRQTDNLEGLSKDLLQFLGSDPVQARSNDDKTLILASRIADDINAV